MNQQKTITMIFRFHEELRTLPIYLFAKDWDFEWRALTWLPAYSSEEETEVGASQRACGNLIFVLPKSDSSHTWWGLLQLYIIYTHTRTHTLFRICLTENWRSDMGDRT